MANQKEIAGSILKAVGGKENISFLTHCMTRLRMNLRDESLLNLEESKKIPEVLGVQKSGGQHQFIIGQTVGSVYQELCKMAGLEDEKRIVQENTDAPKEKKTVKGAAAAVMDGIAGCITPILPAITVAGIIKLIGPSMLGIVSDTSDIYRLLTFAGDTAFYYFPVLIGYAGAKKFGCNIVLGILMGLILVHPSLIQIVADGAPFTVYGIPMTPVNYSSNVISMILITFVMSYVERPIKRYVPDMLKTMLVPVLTILIMLPLALCLLGPVGTYLGNGLAAAILWMQSILGPFAVAIVAALWYLLVATGMHQPLIAYGITLMAQNGYDTIITVGGYTATYALMALMISAFIKLKGKEEKGMAFSAMMSGVFGGIGEPAIFGILLRYKKAIAWYCAGGFAGGLVSGMLGAKVYFFGATNLLSFLSFAGADSSSIIKGCIGSAVAFSVTFALGMIFGYEDSKNE